MNEMSKVGPGNTPGNITAADMDAERQVTYSVEAFLSRDYLEMEKKRLWPKVWQMVERETDLPEPGDWLTYNVADESIIVLRKDDGTLKAFHNVCPHRGRQLISGPDMLPGKVHSVRGNMRKNFVCGFHGWTYDLDGNNTYLLDQQDWKGGLTPELTCLTDVKVDTWGGYIYVNMDPDCVPLKEWMGRAGEILEHVLDLDAVGGVDRRAVQVGEESPHDGAVGCDVVGDKHPERVFKHRCSLT